MNKLFGTDGIRGIANTELTPTLLYSLGKAVTYILTEKLERAPIITLGTDTRISCDMLKAAFITGACSVGAKILDLGVIPTPAVAYLTRFYKADAGTVISASHNSFEFNGIKFFNNKGYKLSGYEEERIEKIVLEDTEVIMPASSEKIGTVSIMSNAIEDYTVFLKSTTHITDFSGMKIVLDCANGAASQIAPNLFKELGVEVYTLHNTPDGLNINESCGSTSIDSLAQLTKELNADIGLAFDGDADRVLAVKENGELLDGDGIMAIICIDLKKKNRLKNNTVVTTIMSNMGFDILAKNEGVNVVKTEVGDKHVIAEMVNNDYLLGGEQSGHVILLEYNTTGDGILTALRLVSILKESNVKLSELSSSLEIFPQVIRNAKVKNSNKHICCNDPIICEASNQLADKLGGTGRLLVRPSGTEPLIRVMLEGRDYEEILEEANNLVVLIEKQLG